MQWNKYIGIPYLDKGRTAEGVDCWGLACLVYKQEFDITLPSYTEEYENEDIKRISETIARYKENWEPTKEPKPGSLILFRIMGAEMHVGVYLGDNKFIHSREGRDVVQERVDSTQWANRVVGYFNYKEKSTGLVVHAVPHPLRTERVTVPVPEGTTVKQLITWVIKEYKIDPTLNQRVVVMVNGKLVPEEKYDTVLKDTDTVEYRALAGKSILKIAILVFVAIVVTPAIVSTLGLTGVPATLATIGINMVAGLLVNALFPVRPPSMPADPGSPERQLLMNGGQNQANKYGAIPVVLGKVRMTAVLGAKNFVESSDETSDLNMLLVWGFGPLAVSELYVGATNIDQYENGIGRPVQYAHLNDAVAEDPAQDYQMFNSIYASDTEQNYHGIKLVNNPTDGEGTNAPWTESTIIESDLVRVGVAFHFPQGLRHLVIKGDAAGAIYAKECLLEVQHRALDANGDPLGPWQDPFSFSKAGANFRLANGLFSYNTTSGYGDGESSYTTTASYYRWTRIALDKSGNYVTKSGSYLTSPYADPVPTYLYNRRTRAYDLPSPNDPNSTFGYVRLPAWTNDEIPLCDVCVYGNNVHIVDTSARRPDYAYTGFSRNTSVSWFDYRTIFIMATGQAVRTLYSSDGEYTSAFPNFALYGGTVSKGSQLISLGTSAYVKRKDAFTHTHFFSVPPNSGGYQIRARRRNSDISEPDDTNRYMHDVQLQTVTGYTNRKPVLSPPNCRITQTAIRIRATDQLNGQVEGINALVETICLDWNKYTQQWNYATTNNPASLFRYILQHPANAQRITDAEVANRINLPALQDWHEYCMANGFEFNAVVSQARSLLEVMRDIAAAGRASPTIIDGKWTVLIDRPRTDIVQHFTPHNSWGFESVKRLPKTPDGLKITFSNELRGFQEEEYIVYAAGKDESNSEVFEQISLPGITRPDLIQRHARWHFAQAKLRPEIYTLNTDLEYLVSNRGDRVKVMHDVPMWGTSSGRIKSKISNTVFELDEPVPMKAEYQYVIRIRAASGASTIRNIVPASFDNYYGQITLTAPITDASLAAAGDLFMFGEVNTETNDLVILSVEPFGNGNAKLTLTDYAPDIYNLNYQATNFYLPDFETNITRPPELLIHSVYVSPTIVSVVSDETVLERISPGVFRNVLKIGISHAPNLPERVTGVEVQIDYAEDESENWLTTGRMPLNVLSATFGDVIEGDQYKIRARYVVDDGRTGPWTPQVLHTIVGKSTPPSAVANFTKVFEAQSATFKLEWSPNTEVDISGYEIRTSNTGWGTSTEVVYKGAETSFRVPAPTSGAPVTYYIKAFDYNKLYSSTAASQVASIDPPSIPLNLTYTYATTSVTATTAVIDWDTPSSVSLPIMHYEVQLVKPQGTVLVKTLSTEYFTTVDWLSSTTANVTAVDTKGNRSPTATLTLPKAPPGQPGTVTTVITDSTITLDWTDSSAGSLPVSGYEIRTSDSGWGINSSYVTRVTASTAIIKDFVFGQNNWYVRAYDTSGQYSISRLVQLPVYIPNPVTDISLELTDTNISGAQAVIKWVPPSVTTFAIKEYEVTLTKYPGPLTQTIRVSGTALSLPVDWRTSLDVAIRVMDILGNYSNQYIESFGKQPPGNITAVTSSAIKTGGVELKWVAPTKGSLAIDGYEIRTESTGAGTPGYVYRGSTNNVIIPNVVLGTNTWYIWAYDTDGHYSATPYTIAFTVAASTAPTTLTATFNSNSNTTSSCVLRWVAPASPQYNVDKYEVTFAYTNPVTSSTTVYRNTTDWEIPANWIDNGTLTVKAIDVNNIPGASAQLVVTKSLPNVPGACTTQPIGSSLEIDWPDTPTTTLPVTLYELRTSDSGWGSAGYYWRGSSSNTHVSLGSGTGARTWYLRAIDSDGRYSATSRTVSFTVNPPTNPVTYPAEFADTSLTSATVTLFWDPVEPEFGLRGYEVTYNGSSELVSATTITLPANWQGDRNFTIKTVDNLGNKSAGIVIVATQLPPNPATNFRAQVIDNNVLLYWNLPAKTTLPISHVRLRKGPTWETAEIIGDKDGTFTSISELTGGTFKYWIVVVDTDNNESIPVDLVASVSQPPDFVFNADYNSDFAATKVNAAYENELQNSLIMPVSLTETFTTHFTSRGWDQPDDQIAAGYPIYAQPGVSSGYYEEVFDYGTLLGSSQINVTLGGNTVSGNPVISVLISTSTDNTSWTEYPGGTLAFAINFRYVRVRVTTTQSLPGDLYRLYSLYVRLDAKQKSDAGNAAVSSIPAQGSIVNFTKEFVDVESLTLTPQGTASRIAVYDFMGTTLPGTYTISSNVATINVVNHTLLAGQKVRLYFSTGSGVPGVYTVSSVINADSYTVSLVAPNGSGSVTTYPNSMRVYLFDNAGDRQSGTVSWAVRGY